MCAGGESLDVLLGIVHGWANTTTPGRPDGFRRWERVCALYACDRTIGSLRPQAAKSMLKEDIIDFRSEWETDLHLIQPTMAKFWDGLIEQAAAHGQCADPPFLILQDDEPIAVIDRSGKITQRLPPFYAVPKEGIRDETQGSFVGILGEDEARGMDFVPVVEGFDFAEYDPECFEVDPELLDVLDTVYADTIEDLLDRARPRLKNRLVHLQEQWHEIAQGKPFSLVDLGSESFGQETMFAATFESFTHDLVQSDCTDDGSLQATDSEPIHKPFYEICLGLCESIFEMTLMATKRFLLKGVLGGYREMIQQGLDAKLSVAQYARSTEGKKILDSVIRVAILEAVVFVAKELEENFDNEV